jgi:hypothetical protein
LPARPVGAVVGAVIARTAGGLPGKTVAASIDSADEDVTKSPNKKRPARPSG